MGDTELFPRDFLNQWLRVYVEVGVSNPLPESVGVNVQKDEDGEKTGRQEKHLAGRLEIDGFQESTGIENNITLGNIYNNRHRTS